MKLKTVFLILSLFCVSDVSASSTADQQALVDRARATVDALLRDDNHNRNLASTLQRCYGAIIVPNLVRAGFLLGAEGGSGVMLKRDANGSWAGPAFIRMIGGSVGLQIGVQQSELILVVMTERGFNAMMNDSFNFGADVNIAMGTLGGGKEVATTANMNADVFAFVRSQGAFAGGSLKGSVIKPRFEWNKQYQGVESPIEILAKNAGNNSGNAASLISALGNLERGTYVKDKGGVNWVSSDTVPAGGSNNQAPSGLADGIEIVPFKPLENEKPLEPENKDIKRAAEKVRMPEEEPVRRTPPLSAEELADADEILVQPAA